MLSIAECLKFESLKRMSAQWPVIVRRVRALEEALGLPEPPVERHVREPRRGIMPSMSLSDFDEFEAIRELNSEWDWIESRIAAIRAALGVPAQARATDSRPSAIAINW